MRKLNNRKYPDGTNPRPDLSKVKREEAKERQTFYNSLSVVGKLELLDQKLGKNVGAKKQRELLQSLLNNKAPALVEQKEEHTEEKKQKVKAKDRKNKEKNKHINSSEED